VNVARLNGFGRVFLFVQRIIREQIRASLWCVARSRFETRKKQGVATRIWTPSDAFLPLLKRALCAVFDPFPPIVPKAPIAANDVPIAAKVICKRAFWPSTVVRFSREPQCGMNQKEKDPN
jgi:hypothetical protein